MTSTTEFEAQIAALDAKLDNSAGLIAQFDAELSGLGRNLALTRREADSLSRSLGGGLRRAFDGVVFDGARLGDALRQVASSMSSSLYNTAMRPVQNALGGALARGIGSFMDGVLPFAQGGVVSAGRVQAFAKGGIVSQATQFPMRGGTTGLMGEAGPEAIMPLSRGADGRLGVRATGGGGPMHVTFNITTPDVAGFQRSQAQIAAQMGRLLAHGQRNY